jgi:hypothetical protein
MKANIGFIYSFETSFPFKLFKTYQVMFNQELNFQNIVKQESNEIANTFFIPSKNQARFQFYSSCQARIKQDNSC